MINYIIVDDEPQARKLIQSYMSALPNYHLAKACANAMEAYEILCTQEIDFMFLDIKMPMVSGIDFLKSLKKPPLVIFTTAFNKYALESYELSVVDYLLKPIAMPRLLNALEKINERLNQKATTAQNPITDHLFFKVENKLVRVDLDAILLIESLQNFVKIHLKDKILLTSNSMKSLESKLPTQQFLRVHRSYIVPIKSIIAINGNTIETTYQPIQIGVSYRNEVMRFAKGSNDY
ncbi:LytTR family DNA-binding domain-containing protein [Pedobacter sp. KR3-3]|uniref:LytTR family DNA-binding domain-containing protein n=1 Tax=Pedobacter albus TaxID=3113905 RepID=A0ABU7I2X3_9SPHI|nr:LytTR family DNA-binding domain-containing protein [Pedobacter sp. KR3-3]MEE1943762.1 LytTR family DNA-binding domain-containing protein [Pedobacter sp. KR3-3]